MGMYNHIIFEYPLPSEAIFRDHFQTKQFDLGMYYFTVTKEGRMFFRGEDVNYHGWLNLYNTDTNGVFHEYYAKFTNGQLECITTEQPLPWELF